MILIQLLLVAFSALASEARHSCELAKENILGRSPTGLTQVSNVADIQITCHVPSRAFPSKPGETRNGLKVATTSYQITDNDGKKFVPSEVKVVGRGFDSESQLEWVSFYIHIPLDPKELESEARRYVAKLEKSMTEEQKSQIKDGDWARALENVRDLVYQHRLGRFQMTCRILDELRELGSDVVEVEVVFKGRFSDIGLPAVPTA